MQQGLVQSVTGLEALADVENLSVTYGIVTNFLMWTFVISEDTKARKHEYSLRTVETIPSFEGLKELVGRIYAMLMPSIEKEVLLVPADAIGAAFGLVSVAQNLASAIASVVVSESYSNAESQYLPQVQTLFIAFGVVNALLALLLIVMDAKGGCLCDCSQVYWRFMKLMNRVDENEGNAKSLFTLAVVVGMLKTFRPSILMHFQFEIKLSTMLSFFGLTSASPAKPAAAPQQTTQKQEQKNTQPAKPNTAQKAKNTQEVKPVTPQQAAKQEQKPAKTQDNKQKQQQQPKQQQKNATPQQQQQPKQQQQKNATAPPKQSETPKENQTSKAAPVQQPTKMKPMTPAQQLEMQQILNILIDDAGKDWKPRDKTNKQPQQKPAPKQAQKTPK
ncbi:hypothetical protein AeMF1_007427, partial [Aphanomyces euteiches]